MSSIAKNIFNFSKNNDLDVNAKISKIESIIRDLERQKHHQMPLKVKAILNIAYDQQNGPSLFQQVYISCMKQSPIQWVPKLGRLLNLFSANSSFMKIILETQDFKIPIQKNFLPAYLFRNNLLNEKSAYHNISTSISGLTVPLLDYVIIRLLHGISQSSFIIQTQKKPHQQYDSDDFFYYLSRNPYLLVLKNYLDFVGNSQKNILRIANNMKIFFVDELLLKHRINRSTSYLRELSSITARYKLKPQNLLAVYLLLQKDKVLFQERSIFFYELVERFYSLIENQNQIFFRFLFRIFTFAYSKNSVENKVIDLLHKSNPVDGYFELSRYSIDEFGKSIQNNGERKQKNQYSQSKPLLLKLLQKDQNLGSYKKIQFNTLRTLGAFLCLQIQMNTGYSSSTKQKTQDHLRKNSQASSIQIGFEKMYRSIRSFLKNQKARKSRTFTQDKEKKLMAEIHEIVDLFFQAYGRKIDLSKFEDYKQSTFDRTFNIRGANEDFTLSVETYKKDIQVNCWKVPLKDSEYQILYDLFYGLAKFIDKMIPGHKAGNEPRVNLRYFCNPIVFMLTMIMLVMLMKIIF